ncbi:hypothetical protein BGW36DRAFT_389670 [Talaromyces proteolyticus]|uniref:F-box domain-containing protein n=1 Tax=Talaromyces proteolyticus TaxID=1131652 RepID=A0AAD4KFU2_9EURO|nr:uncharacterized protein BGW36DRAFT_389670 [Talaromyces proteolyticus]KAH8690957.1 hypothetical protein BGW36DRAFT_389670 [Talaromyces proteolyticus]
MAQHEISQIANAFTSLPPQARQTALDQLLDALHTNEWRELNRRATHALQRDIVGCLPLEIVVEIAQYLEPRDILRFQRVSKRWRTVLSSNNIYIPILRFYGVPTPDLPTTELVHTICERRYRLEKGSPYDEALYPWLDGPDYLPTPSPEVVSYCSGKLAWVSRDERQVFVRDLQSGTVKAFFSESRGTIVLVHLSETFLYAVSSGFLNVWDLTTGHTKSARMPSSKVVEINTHGDRAVIILHTHPIQHMLLSWHFESGSLGSTLIEGEPMLFCWDKSATTIDVVILEVLEVNNVRPACWFAKKRFSVADDTITLLEYKPLASPINNYISPPWIHVLGVTSYRHKNYSCRYGTTVCQIIPSTPSTLRFRLPHEIYISYCAQSDRLTVLELDNDYSSAIGKSGHLKYPGSSNQARLLSPDGIIYLIFEDSGELWIKNILTAKSNLAEFSPRAHDYIMTRNTLAFGDHQLFGMISVRGIAVWSFDPELRLYKNISANPPNNVQ